MSAEKKLRDVLALDPQHAGALHNLEVLRQHKQRQGRLAVGPDGLIVLETVQGSA